MARTSPQLVQKILGADYGQLPNGCGNPDLASYVDSASVIVDQVVQMALHKRRTLTPQQQELIERWLAAWFYTRSDPIYQTKGQKGSSASYVSEPKHRYLLAAEAVDTSGCLIIILERKVAGGFSGAFPP